MKNRSKRSGFSLVELMFSVALLGVFFLGIGTFFLRGNKAAAKGTWRTHVIKRMRTGIKLIQTALNKTSYPSYTSDNSFIEMKPWDIGAEQYYVNLGKAFTKDTSDFVDFNAEDYVGDILTVTAVTPHQDFSSGEQTGIATVYRFFFPPVATETEIKVPNSDGVVDSRGDAFTDGVHLVSLYYEIQTGAVTYAPGGGFTMGALTTYMSSRPLIPNVNRFSAKVFRKTQNHEYSLADPPNTYEDDFPKITLQLELECRDPLDGRLVVSQNLIYLINTHVRGS